MGYDFVVDTIALTDFNIKNLRDIFGLNEGYFLDMPDELVYLAFTPDNRDYKRKNLYDAKNHQSLEFYGDKILYNIICNILSDIFSLSIDAKFLTDITSYLSKNLTLTNLMLSHNACSYVNHSSYNIKKTGKIHNICADSFEALIGALNYYLKQNKLDSIEILTDWILKWTNFGFYMRRYMDNAYTIEGLKDYYIVCGNIKSILKQNWDDYYNNMLKNTKNSSLISYYKNMLKIDKFPEYRLLISLKNKSNINYIYSALGFDYDPISLNDELYVCVGPEGTETSEIAYGNTYEQVVENAVNYLILAGYIDFTDSKNYKVKSNYIKIKDDFSK